MVKKSFVFAVFVSLLGGVGTLNAQQAESLTPGKPQPPEIKEFQGYEDQWSTALVKADQYTMEYLLSPVYVDISAKGSVTTRNQQIADLFDKGSTPISMEQKVVSVREFGDTALVSGTYIAKWRNDGKVREERGVFTHVYERSHNHWACVNAQRTAVLDMIPGAKEKKQEKNQAKSDAAEPFHIPFFHKGAEPSATAREAPPMPQN